MTVLLRCVVYKLNIFYIQKNKNYTQKQIDHGPHKFSIVFET